jgi:hypothetical protein
MHGLITGQLQAALQYCTTALKRIPNDADSLDSRGLAYLKLGQYANASSQQRSVIAAIAISVATVGRSGGRAGSWCERQHHCNEPIEPHDGAILRTNPFKGIPSAYEQMPRTQWSVFSGRLFPPCHLQFKGDGPDCNLEGLAQRRLGPNWSGSNIDAGYEGTQAWFL